MLLAVLASRRQPKGGPAASGSSVWTFVSAESKSR
jgi:hypothetical protein